MAKLVTGLFNTRSSAILAIEDMMRHGFAQDDLSLLNTDTNVGREFFTDLASKAPEGGVIGAIIGMLLGGILAYLMATGNLQDGGMGIAALRPEFAIMVGVGALGLIGLLVGAAIGSTIPEFEINMYRADGKRHGGILVGAYSHARRETEIRRLMEASGATRVRTKNVRDEKLPQPEYDRIGDREVAR